MRRMIRFDGSIIGQRQRDRQDQPFQPWRFDGHHQRRRWMKRQWQRWRRSTSWRQRRRVSLRAVECQWGGNLTCFCEGLTLDPAEERLLRPEVTEDPTEEAAESAALVIEEATEPADPVTPPTTPLIPEIVEDPIVVSKVELPEVSVETMAEVVIADEDPPVAPPAPKIVVEPTTVEKVESPEVTVEKTSEVVMAEEDPLAPPA